VVLLRGPLVKIMLKTYNPQAAAMIIPYSVTMVLFGLNQAIGMWSLANRWLKMAMTYGALGLSYWLALFYFGRTPAMLLRIMPLMAGAAFCVLCVSWLVTLRQAPANAAK
jgi:hypothetical protein